MSTLYSFESAATNPTAFIQETVELAKAIRNDPTDIAHLEPLLGLSGVAAKTVRELKGGLFAVAATPEGTVDSVSVEQRCNTIIETVEGRQAYATAEAGGLWTILAPQLMQLLLAWLANRTK